MQNRIQNTVIKILTEMVEYGHKMEENVKAMLSEWREMYREPTVKETGTQINNLGQKKEIHIQPEQKWRNKNSKKWGEA